MSTRTPAQIEASRKNGAKSKGPSTEEGKSRSSQNAIKHGLSAHKIVVLENESEDEWEAFHAPFIAKFRPRDVVEAQLVLEMAVNRWRLRRSWAMQTAAIDVETAREKGYVPEGYEEWDSVKVNAYSHNSRREQLDSLSQFETRLTRNFDRALRNLTQLRKQQAFLENEPETTKPRTGISGVRKPSSGPAREDHMKTSALLENEPGKYNSEIGQSSQNHGTANRKSDGNGVIPQPEVLPIWRDVPHAATSEIEARTQ